MGSIPILIGQSMARLGSLQGKRRATGGFKILWLSCVDELVEVGDAVLLSGDPVSSEVGGDKSSNASYKDPL